LLPVSKVLGLFIQYTIFYPTPTGLILRKPIESQNPMLYANDKFKLSKKWPKCMKKVVKWTIFNIFKLHKTTRL
jgi:hypothetical protein